MKIKFTLLVLSLFLVASYSLAQDESKGQSDDLARKVEKKILDNNKIQIENLKVLNNNGTIYMEGVARLYGSRYKAEEIATKVDGVTKVDNQIALVSRESTDLEIQGTLLSKIKSKMKGSPFDLVQIKVNHGFVTLLGIVRDTTLKDDAFEVAIWIPGVKNVKNDMRFASVSSGDERLRQQIFRRLRADYPIYFNGKDPSIIILSEGSRIALVGNVNSNVDRERIGNIVRSIQGVLSVENQLSTE